LYSGGSGLRADIQGSPPAAPDPQSEKHIEADEFDLDSSICWSGRVGEASDIAQITLVCEGVSLLGVWFERGR